jgi:hypothetical protein
LQSVRSSFPRKVARKERAVSGTTPEQDDAAVVVIVLLVLLTLLGWITGG